MDHNSDSNSNSSSTSGTGGGSDALRFITEIGGALKQLKRTGWVMRRVPFPESDSDHMHRCALCAMLVTSQPVDPRDSYTDPAVSRFHPEQINGNKLLRMALTHDLCEALAGDITPFCGVGVDQKHEKEKTAMERIRSMVGDPLGKELYDLWLEYEQQETADAIYCKDIDKFEMVVQAYEYEKLYLQNKPNDVDSLLDLVDGEDLPAVVDQPLRRFFKTTRSCMQTPMFRRLDQELRDRREVMLREEKGGWKVTDEERQYYPNDA